MKMKMNLCVIFLLSLWTERGMNLFINLGFSKKLENENKPKSPKT